MYVNDANDGLLLFAVRKVVFLQCLSTRNGRVTPREIYAELVYHIWL